MPSLRALYSHATGGVSLKPQGPIKIENVTHEVQIDFKEIKGQEHVKRALDEFPEFVSRMLDMLRQPIENKVVTISRASESLTFPANFMLVAAMSPYPCGYYGDTVKECTCSTAQVISYQKRISGPLLNRIDIQIQVPRVD